MISYHSSGSDPFYTTEASQRYSYYNVSGYPTTWFDGTISEVGGLHDGTMYPFFRHHVTTRLGVSSPLEITLNCTYDSVANSGSITATILNTSGSSVGGTLHFVVIEDNIVYNWQGMTELDHLMRDMLPNASGEAVTIPAADTIIRSRNFTIGSTWNELNCKIVVFVQAASKQIYQGDEIAIIQEPKMEYYGLSLSEISGNGNGWAEPGESIEINALGKNLGAGIYTGGASIQCSDTYITITGSIPATVSIGPGDVDTVITFTFDISPSCPNPHQTSFDLDFGSSTDNIPFVITTQPGFSDNIESGQGNWTHSGTSDNWHITEYKSNSPTHSWYSGVEGSWQYTNENDASLVSPYFVATPDSNLYFYHQYSLETNWDYSYIELDNGSGWWRTLDEFNGTQSSWNQVSYPLNAYAGQTIRIRFRFVSDYSVTQEGWYVDDIKVPLYIGVEEQISNRTVQTPLLQIYPNPFSKATDIQYQITDDRWETKDISLKIYDATGRLVKDFSCPTHYALRPTHISWNGTDDFNRKLPCGIYFIQLDTGKSELIEKVILLK